MLLNQELDMMTAKFKSLKSQHNGELEKFKKYAEDEVAALKSRYESQIQDLNN